MSETGLIPVVEPTERELFNGTWSEHTLKRISAMFRLTGGLQIRNLLPVEFVDEMREAYVERYADYFRDPPPEDALKVGDGRIMISVHVEHPFSDTNAWANRLVLSFLHEMLGYEMILLSYGSVTALPGCKAQKIHIDHPPLFSEYDSINWAMPSFAVTLVVPLVDHTVETGTTRVWPGSHLTPFEDGGHSDPVDMFVPKGTVYLMDYRTWHAGTENRSDRLRPALYLVYARDWFRDTVNYHRQLPILLERRTLAKAPKNLRPLLSWIFPPDAP